VCRARNGQFSKSTAFILIRNSVVNVIKNCKRCLEVLQIPSVFYSGKTCHAEKLIVYLAVASENY